MTTMMLSMTTMMIMALRLTKTIDDDDVHDD